MKDLICRPFLSCALALFSATFLFAGCHDRDRDGYYAETGCGTAVDCDDQDNSIYPGAPQICDGKNNDCNDPNWPALTGTNENDGDGDSFTPCGGDCNDNDDVIYPNAPELCDNKDNDCDGSVDEGLSTDADGDGHYTPGSCFTPDDDCDDTNPQAFPGAGEILCDAVDENCDSSQNEAPDNDGDGFDACGSNDVLNPDGLEKDCNDGNPAIHPEAIEICNGFDDNCNGTLDEGCDAVCDNPEKSGLDVRITTASGESSFPSLVWNGSGYGVSWVDYRIEYRNDIYFARLDSSGNKIGSDIRVTWIYNHCFNPSLIWNGDEYGVSWYEDDGKIYFARLDISGNKVGNDVRVTNDAVNALYPKLVWSGSEYGISWYDYRYGPSNAEIYFARLDASGNKAGNDVRVTYDAASSFEPSLVWNGSGYGISWHDYRDGNWEIYFARLDASGNKIGSDVRVTNDGSSSYIPSLVWNGSGYGVSWYDYRDGNYAEIYFARLDVSGNKSGGDVRVTNDAASSWYPRLVWTGNEYGIFWYDERNGNEPEIYFARVDASGNKLGGDLRLTNNAGYSRCPSPVWNGGEYGVSWYDAENGNLEIYFAKVSCCNDVDMDTYTECAGDCNDSDASIFPGAPELCDSKDNDCNGTIDEGFLTPGGTSGLIFEIDKETMDWDVEEVADRYDIVKGDLMALRSTQGDFSLSVTSCLENDSMDTGTNDSYSPLSGQGFYYIVRGQKDCKSGTYNAAPPGQIGDRDSEIESSSNRCQ